MSVDTQKAFDLSVYAPAELSKRLPIDAVCVSMDAEDPQTRETPFAVPFTFVVDFANQTVVRPDYSNQDVRAICCNSPDIVAICEHFLNKDNYKNTNIYLWISGPDGYPDSRLNIGVGKITSPDIAEIKNYGGLNTNLDEQECLDLAYWASGFNPNGAHRHQSLTELRDNPIFISCPDGNKTWEWVLVQVLKDPRLFEFIDSGKADFQYEQRLKITKELTKGAVAGISTATTGREFVYWGAWIENMMMATFGIILDGQASGCGLLNSDLLASFASPIVLGLPEFRPKKTKKTEACVEIECTVCHWKPNEEQLRQIENKTLTHCPKCEPES